WVRVAKKYPHMAEQYFTDRGIQVELVRLDGSIELAPLVGLAERIVDLVQSGATLRANGLVEVAEIARSTARLIVNRASMRTEHAAVNELITDMKGAVRAQSVSRPCSVPPGRGEGSTMSWRPWPGRRRRSRPRFIEPSTRSSSACAPGATRRSASTRRDSTAGAPPPPATSPSPPRTSRRPSGRFPPRVGWRF